ncbi:MAG: hypothetical protein OXC11_14240 [Rhodospirillales bacterium]|nr:hypothetical protein [Rhodospirillales bacterium]
MSKSRIESVTECWQRDLMTAGEGRKARPVAEARTALKGMRGTVAELTERARPVADAHLVAVGIRTPAGNLHVVTPD